MSATLRLRRHVGFAIELRRGRFDVVVDGTGVGSIENEETFETPLEPGHHTLRLQAGRYSSRPASFDVADGDVVSFRGHGANIWPVYVASIVVPTLAITLKRE